MSNKRRVFVTLFHRDELSLGENRRRLGVEAYHWAILIAPKAVRESNTVLCESFDVTNGAKIDAVNQVNLNPQGDWYFRNQRSVNPRNSGRFLGMLMIGKLPNDVDINSIARELGSLQLPSRHVQGQHCIWWAKRAVRQLQSRGLAEQFDVERMEADTLRFADEVFESWRTNSASTELTIKNYTNRPL